MYPDLALYVGGEWKNGGSRKGEDVINPATEKPLARLPHASTADLDEALAAATKGFEAYEHHPGDDQTYPWGFIYICPNCNKATFHCEEGMTPAPLPDAAVLGLPADVRRMYQEARQAAGARAFTASAMVCRTILMHVAVDKGAKVHAGAKTVGCATTQRKPRSGR